MRTETLNILITDDERSTREDIRDAIERVSPGNAYTFARNYDEAVGAADENTFDIAFLDINMPGKSGLELVKSLKKLTPDINIIMVTAYEDYALSALRLFVSGYLLKPVMDDDIREALENLRNPIGTSGQTVRAICFGNFEIFYRDKAIAFSRKKSKELLAYLICLKGSGASRGEICANIFEEYDTKKGYDYFKKVVSSLKKDLSKEGIEDLLIHGHNSYAINTSMIKCDYYDYLSDGDDTETAYRGEFMNQYSWAEQYIYALENY